MAKKDNKAHDGNQATRNHNHGENQNSFVMRGSPQLDQQFVAKQNLAQNSADGNRHYAQAQRELDKEKEAFEEE